MLVAVGCAAVRALVTISVGGFRLGSFEYVDCGMDCCLELSWCLLFAFAVFVGFHTVDSGYWRRLKGRLGLSAL
ncbi:hypothetical protein BU26DRAFT_521780 [Trematosphaeria pertusa]|uniref:Uncharacterized protein n=1 Tax=Trematosphaeria pertusa TaxID=390896 RepID=A0A6A6I5P6_9PLEO|nr:uncharacterized protein BU26DRAFT_521780 [Trematosphaeria pertusa]KAF2245272.1 hypothetical protein BU26DRAFT_521780 [Trematosphaeria pertusa]